MDARTCAGDARAMSEPLRVWTVEEALQLMTEQELSADMEPTLNEVEQTWDVCLSDERGNGIEYISFATEAEADQFCAALGEAIEQAAASAPQA